MDQLAPTVTHKQKTTTASKRMLNTITPVRAYNTAGTALALLNETLPNKKKTILGFLLQKAGKQ